MLVVDTSAVLATLVVHDLPEGLMERVTEDEDLHAPHLIDVEVLHALRRLTARGELTVERAADARTDFSELTIARYAHQGLADRIWELRHNLTAYDAAFVALAEAIDAPLVTCDGRLTAAPGTTADIELFGAV